MQVRTTYKVRARLSKDGYKRLDAVLAVCCTLYNNALEERRSAWKARQQRITRYDQFRSQTNLRNENPDLYAIAAAVTRAPLRRVDDTFNAYYRRLQRGMNPGYPRFKPIHRYNTIEVSGNTMPAVRRRKWTMKGLPVFHLSKRDLPNSAPVVVCITRRARRVYLNLTYLEEREPLPYSPLAIGLDMGVSSTITTSSHNHIRRHQISWKRRRRLQRGLNRARSSSKNREKRRRSYNREMERIQTARRNEAHRITTDLVQRYGTICIEELRVSRMTRSAKGTLNSPGRGVSAKRGLNREIQNQAWAQIRTMLHYKAEWAGRNLVLVNPAYTSQDCSACGARNPGPTPNRVYECRACGLTLDRDENAAVNILRRGVSVLAAVGNEKSSADEPRDGVTQPQGVLVEPVSEQVRPPTSMFRQQL